MSDSDLIKFTKTKKQKEAIELLASLAKYIALFGGSRSGKTVILCYAIMVRALKCAESRHVILRQRFNAVKTSVFLDTFPKVIRMAFPEIKSLAPNKSDYYYQIPNGSEIWFAGLDDGERTEKILGREYSTLYFNECSQISYSSVQMALSRLAQKNELKKKVYFDFNPPKKTHWSYPLFIKGLDPIDSEPLPNREQYAYLKINPEDNLENIDEDYINILRSMPEEHRKRFLEGEFTDQTDGQAYYEFRQDEQVSDEVALLPGTAHLGMDFNVNPMTSLVAQVVNGKLHVIDEFYLPNSDTYKMMSAVSGKNYKGLRVVPDSTGRNRKTSGVSDFEIIQQAGFVIESVKNPFITDRVQNVNRLLKEGRIVIHPRCKKLINDLEMVMWKDNKLDQSGASKHLTHISDCLGYLCWFLFPLQPEIRRATSFKTR